MTEVSKRSGASDNNIIEEDGIIKQCRKYFLQDDPHWHWINFSTHSRNFVNDNENNVAILCDKYRP